jgi:hypothetical protein
MEVTGQVPEKKESLAYCDKRLASLQNFYSHSGKEKFEVN